MKKLTDVESKTLTFSARELRMIEQAVAYHLDLLRETYNEATGDCSSIKEGINTLAEVEDKLLNQ